MIKNYDESDEINNNSNWIYIPDHSYKILIIGGTGSGKTNAFLKLGKHQRPHVDKIYLYAKDPLELNYQLLTNGREKVEIKLNMKKIQRHLLITHKQLMVSMKI